MKKLLLSLLFVNIIALSQDKYNGTFELSNHKEIMWWEYDTFSFYNDSLFKFLRWTDYGALYGEGNYILTDSRLTLKFAKNLKDTSNSKFETLSSSNSMGETVSYRLKVMTSSAKKLTGAMVDLKNVKDTLNIDSSQISNYETNKKGVVVINIKKDKIPVTLTIFYYGMKQLVINVTDSLNRNCNVFLYNRFDWLSYISKTDVMIFKIRKINDDEFYIKRDEVEYWLLYKKSDEELDINTFKY